MSAIIPAILPLSRVDLNQKTAALFGLTDWVQIDIVDGRFASPPSWPYTSKEGLAELNAENPLPHLGRMRYELDLMATDPEKLVGECIAAGANRLVLHAESSRFLPKTMEQLNTLYGHDKNFAPDLLSLGVALNIASEISLLEPFLPYADYVQFMGIADIGKQGQPFDQHVIRKIAEFRKKHPDILIQVDGGVSLTTIRALLEIGVDRMIVGSALWKAPNLHEAFEQFNDIVREYNA